MKVTLDRQCELLKLPKLEPEYRFHPSRRWRFDYAIPAKSIGIEVEGGAFVNGRHTRGVGFVKDLEKYAEAAILGWTVLRVTPQMVADGRAVGYIERLVNRNAVGGRLVESSEFGHALHRQKP